MVDRGATGGREVVAELPAVAVVVAVARGAAVVVLAPLDGTVAVPVAEGRVDGTCTTAEERWALLEEQAVRASKDTIARWVRTGPVCPVAPHLWLSAI